MGKVSLGMIPRCSVPGEPGPDMGVGACKVWYAHVKNYTSPNMYLVIQCQSVVIMLQAIWDGERLAFSDRQVKKFLVAAN